MYTLRISTLLKNRKAVFPYLFYTFKVYLPLMKILKTILLLLFIISKVSAHQGGKFHGNDKIWNTGKTSEQGSFLMLLILEIC